MEKVIKQTFLLGVEVTVKAVEDALRKEFGFGEKRLARLSKVVNELIESEGR